MDFVLSKIDKQLDNYRSLDQHMKDLKKKLKELNGLKEDTESVMSTELRPRKKLKMEVQIWLENVERINGQVQELDGRIGESRALTRGFRTEDVLKTMKEVEQLIIQQGKFHKGLVVDNPQWIGQVLSTTSLSGEAAKACADEIWQCLMDDGVLKIGVWGMGGVGKTSIMKVINNELLNETEKLDNVIWITVSKAMTIARLQKVIASQIKVTICDDECEVTRAGMIYETLSRKRFLLILDDIWEKVSLERVGIPEPSAGSKLMLTTRSADVCRQMGFKEIKVNPLEEEETWNLFSEKVGRDIVNIPGVESIAKSVAKRCEGLPLAITSIASVMKDTDDLSEWRNALEELKGRTSVNRFEDEIFQQLQFSYNRLKDPILQGCFLSGTLYPQGFSIKEEDLTRLWIAEGVVEEMDSRQAQYDRAHAVLQRLINNGFVEPFTERDDGRCVRMHDLLRDMALSIVNAEHRYLVNAGMGLTEPPDVQEWNEELEKISLMENWELQVIHPSYMPPPKCPKLTTLLLSDCDIRSIPEGFFKHMHSLKILDLSRNRSIKSLPSSLSSLEKLAALLLEGCGSLENVPSLSNLRALKELNLEGTNIIEVPHGMQNLSSLEYLNLRLTRVYEIPYGMLARVSNLQNLNLGETLISGEEVGGLRKLEIFEGRFFDLHNLNTYVQILNGREEPREYAIRVGSRGRRPQQHKTRKCIELSGCIISPGQIMLPRYIEELYVDECSLNCREEYLCFTRFIQASLASFSSLKLLQVSGCRNIVKLFSPSCMPLNLEQLTVDGCYKLNEVIASEVGPEETAMVTTEFRLPHLKVFSLCNLPVLKSICSADRTMVCDSLDEIWVVNCPILKRMPLHLPKVDNVGPSPPLSLSLSLRIRPKEWWESVEWDHPNAKSLLQPFLTFW